jgi:Ferredoxin
MKWYSPEIICLFFLSFIFILLPSGCSFNSSQPTNPLQKQSKVVFEVPSDINADLYRITIVIQNGDTVMYYEIAKGNTIAINVPSKDTSVVTIDAYRAKVLISSGSISIPAGQTGMMKISLQPIEFPKTPSGLTAVVTADLQIALSWQACSGVQGYTLYRTTDTGTTPTVVGKITDASFVDASADVGVSYFYRVSAWNAAGESTPSAYVSIVIIQQTVPDVPQNVVAQANGVSSITVSWTAVTGATGYIVYGGTSPSLLSQLDTATATTYSQMGLTQGSAYYYAVAATNASGTSARSIPVIATTLLTKPATPQSLIAAAVSETGIRVTWNAARYATSYIVKWSTQAAGPFTSATVDTAAYLVSGLITSTTYFFQVIAVNEAGQSDASLAVSATTPLAKPATPQSVAASTISETSIRVSWNAAQYAANYIVQWSTQSAGPFTSATSDTTMYVIGGLTASTLYYVQVSASNSAGQSAVSTTVTATTLAPPLQPPSAPALTATSRSDTSIQVSWQQVQNAANYIIERSTASSGPFSAICTTAALAWTNTKLGPNTAYYYRGKATNSAGASGYSATVSATTAVRVAVPSGLASGAVTSTSITITWQAAAGAQSYKIYRSSSATGTFASVGIATVAQYADNGLTPSAIYYYKVSSVNGTNESAQSAALSVTTSTAAPVAPTGVAATPISSSSITVSWTAVTGATGYIVYGGASSSSLSQLGTPATTSYSHTGLTAGTTYYYAVAATNASGTSARSTTVSATTQAAGPTTPTGLKATAASSTSITVTWTAVTGATSYKLYTGTNNSTFTLLTTVTATTFTHTGLTAGTIHYYKVSAVQSSVESAQSTSVSATTSTATKKAVITGCHGCGRCVSSCSHGAISRSGSVYVIDPSKCTGDGNCVSACPYGCIKMQ